MWMSVRRFDGSVVQWFSRSEADAQPNRRTVERFYSTASGLWATVMGCGMRLPVTLRRGATREMENGADTIRGRANGVKRVPRALTEVWWPEGLRRNAPAALDSRPRHPLG